MLESSDPSEYRILSLDGGGTWALIQVMALQSIYGPDAKGHDVLSHFHLVAANSGGSLTLAGMLENLSLDQILNQYFLAKNSREQIFVKASFFEDPLNVTLHKLFGFGARYRASAKLTGLQHLLPRTGGEKLEDLSNLFESPSKCPDIVICAFDYQAQRARYFRSNLNSKAASGSRPLRVTLAEAIHASANAPVNYFDAPAIANGRQYWDGGVAGLNNPILAAVTESLANDNKREDIRALSIGTATPGFLPFASPGQDSRLTQPITKPSVKNDLRKLASSVVDDPPDAATFIAHVALSQPIPKNRDSPPVTGNLIRMNPLIRPASGKHPNTWVPPNLFTADDFKALADLELDAVEESEVNLIQRLAMGWIAGDFPNQPIRMDPSTLSCEIGHITFAAAHTAWRKLCPGPP
ncbi:MULTISPECIES: patatin-like phospholipase family protein [Pseudomonas]|uniref:Acylesterase/phospholipase RssA n=1 Tax=Pseudomonas umsongensis TaxID=198618 RepID=A0ACC5MF60_9PSED|nr:MULTISPECIES: patatin-like phospholipase family protein [Pseudomonas]MBB2887210.1 putative acylesterase/phospholipase RssA [Pseudomonas umsongensis]NMN78652.1 Patatin [Pseudomonas sp. KD5]